MGTVAVVLGLLYFFGDDTSDPGDDPVADDTRNSTTDSPSTPATSEATQDPTSDPTSDPTQAGPVTAPPEVRVPVGVLNNTNIAGLAASAQQRFEAGGWEVVGITDLRSVTIEESTIFYPTEDTREAAEAFAAQFPEIGRVEPRGSMPISSQHPVVVLGEDYDEESGELG